MAKKNRTPAITEKEQPARARALYAALLKLYPDAHCELDYRNPFELLVATILSAQTTDVAVNKVTPALFRKYPTPAALAKATPAEIEPFIKSIGLFRNKAKSIHGAAVMIQEQFAGEVPRKMDDLLELPGVARKTANVVLGEAFGVAEGVVVDTHVQRLAARFGFVKRDEKTAKIEQRLMELFERSTWPKLSHLLIWHGRRACTARGGTCCGNPVCSTFGVACEKRDSDKPQ